MKTLAQLWNWISIRILFALFGLEPPWLTKKDIFWIVQSTWTYSKFKSPQHLKCTPSRTQSSLATINRQWKKKKLYKEWNFFHIQAVIFTRSNQLSCDNHVWPGRHLRNNLELTCSKNGWVYSSIIKIHARR